MHIKRLKGFCLFYLLFFFYGSQCCMDPTFIENYLSHRYIEFCIIFNCGSIKDQMKLYQSLAGKFRTAHYNVKNFCRNFLQDMPERVGVIVNSECEHFVQFMMQCNTPQLFNIRRSWLIVANNSDDTINKTIMPQLSKLPLNINSDVKVGYMYGKRTDDVIWNILDVYNPAVGHGGTLKIQKHGNFSSKFGLKVSSTKNLYVRRKNMTGVTFKMMTVLPKPHSTPLEKYLRSDKNRYVDSFNRYHTHLVYHCEEIYNFSLQLSETISWGYAVKNGTFDGLIGHLQNKTVDFGSPVFYKKERLPIIDYGRRTWNFNTAFIFRNPKSLASLQRFLQPLSRGVYISALLIVLFLTLSLKYAVDTELFIHKIIKNKSEHTWGFLSLVVLGTLCQQGSSWSPKLCSGRIVLLFILLISVLLNQFYSGSILSYILMKTPRSINTLEDLITSRMKCGCEDVLYNKDYFRDQTNPVTRDLYWLKLVQKDGRTNFFSVEDGVAMVRRGGFAFQVEVQQAYPIIGVTFEDEQICDLEEIEMLQTQHVYAPFQKDSPFRDMLNYCFNWMDEVGVMHRQRIHWEAKKPACLQESKLTLKTVGLDEFFPVVLIFLIGVFLSLFFLGLEIMVYKWKDANRPVKEQEMLFPFVN